MSVEKTTANARVVDLQRSVSVPMTLKERLHSSFDYMARAAKTVIGNHSYDRMARFALSIQSHAIAISESCASEPGETGESGKDVFVVSAEAFEGPGLAAVAGRPKTFCLSADMQRISDWMAEINRHMHEIRTKDMDPADAISLYQNADEGFGLALARATNYGKLFDPLANLVQRVEVLWAKSQGFCWGPAAT